MLGGCCGSDCGASLVGVWGFGGAGVVDLRGWVLMVFGLVVWLLVFVLVCLVDFLFG